MRQMATIRIIDNLQPIEGADAIECAVIGGWKVVVKKGEFRMSFENQDVEIDLKTGKGEIISFFKTPLISQTMQLHKNTSNFWIYYSDIFAISLITIALTGTVMIKAGKFSWKQRGWKLAVAGIIFPLLFLFLLG